MSFWCSCCCGAVVFVLFVVIILVASCSVVLVVALVCCGCACCFCLWREAICFSPLSMINNHYFLIKILLGRHEECVKSVQECHYPHCWLIKWDPRNQSAIQPQPMENLRTPTHLGWWFFVFVGVLRACWDLLGSMMKLPLLSSTKAPSCGSYICTYIHIHDIHNIHLYIYTSLISLYTW